MLRRARADGQGRGCGGRETPVAVRAYVPHSSFPIMLWLTAAALCAPCRSSWCGTSRAASSARSWFSLSTRREYSCVGAGLPIPQRSKARAPMAGMAGGGRPPCLLALDGVSRTVHPSLDGVMFVADMPRRPDRHRASQGEAGGSPIPLCATSTASSDGAPCAYKLFIRRFGVLPRADATCSGTADAIAAGQACHSSRAPPRAKFVEVATNGKRTINSVHSCVTWYIVISNYCI